MKKIFGMLTIFVLMIAVMPTQAQTPTPKVGDPSTYLTAEQQAKYYSDLKIAELEKKLQTYGNWVGVGGEVGTAIKEGLTAVVDVADQFGKTDVGKFTMYMVAWKVIGKDIVRIVLGLIFIAIFTWLLIYSFKRTCIERRVLVENKNAGWFRYPKEKKYEIIEPRFGNGEGLGAIRVLHIIFFLIGIWITYAVMFAG